jgi:hypothetical protein
VVAEDCDGGSAGRVVLWREDAAAERADSEGGEVVAGDVLGAKGQCGAGTAASYADAAEAGLKGCELFEFRGLRTEALYHAPGKHAPLALGAALDAAVIAFADSIQRGGVCDREGAEHDGIDEGEDGGGATDAEGQSQDGRCCEAR